jgi:hypothetical protein
LLRAVIGNFLFGLRLIDGTRYKAINRGIEEMFPWVGLAPRRCLAQRREGSRPRDPLFAEARTCS